MEQVEVDETLTQLQEELQQRGNQLMSQDPVAQRILGKIEAYKSITSLVSTNGELIEETE